MAETTSTEQAFAAEEEGYYHESALNAAWTGSWLAIGGLTLLFGATFLAVKFTEYAIDYRERLIPGLRWEPEGIPASLDHGAQLFFIFYFILTGLHAVHMLIGMGLLVYLLVGARRGRFSSEHFTPVEVIGLYWHFVDIVWIFLFPLLYLIRH